MYDWLGLPRLASAHGGQIDQLIGFIHIVMFTLFIGWGAFFAFLLVTGIQVCLANFDSETEALKWPYGIVYACVPISGILMLLDSLSEIWMKVRGKNRG